MTQRRLKPALRTAIPLLGLAILASGCLAPELPLRGRDLPSGPCAHLFKDNAEPQVLIHASLHGVRADPVWKGIGVEFHPPKDLVDSLERMGMSVRPAHGTTDDDGCVAFSTLPLGTFEATATWTDGYRPIDPCAVSESGDWSYGSSASEPLVACGGAPYWNPCAWTGQVEVQPGLKRYVEVELELWQMCFE